MIQCHTNLVAAQPSRKNMFELAQNRFQRSSNFFLDVLCLDYHRDKLIKHLCNTIKDCKVKYNAITQKCAIQMTSKGVDLVDSCKYKHRMIRFLIVFNITMKEFNVEMNSRVFVISVTF